MKKLIIIEDNFEIKVGYVVQSEKGNLGIVIELDNDNHYKVKYFDGKISIENKHTMPKVQLYIVNTEIKDKLHQNIIYNNKLYFVEQLINTEPRLAIGKGFINSASGDVIIATSNPFLSLPQLSGQAIDLIVENNGEIGEFDVDFGNGNTSCQNCSLNTKYEPNTCIHIKQCAINNKYFIPIANIIFKSLESIEENEKDEERNAEIDYKGYSNITSIEECNNEVCQNSIEEAALNYADINGEESNPNDIERAFIAGVKSNAAKEYWQQNMSSYGDVSHAIGYTFGQCKLGLSHEQILIEYNKVHRKPYIDKRKK